jgi:hypothetical protein
VAAAACAAGLCAGLPALEQTGLDARGAWVVDLGADAAAARAIQRSAAAAHASQSEGLLQVQHRLDALGGREHLRWLRCA